MVSGREHTSKQTLILVGGGHAHLQVICDKSFHNINRLLISETDIATYSGLLPATVAGLCEETAANVSLRPLCAAHGVHFIQGTVVKVVPQNRRIFVRPPDSRGDYALSYTVLSLNIGSVTKSIPLANSSPASSNAHVIPTRPISSLIPAFRKFESVAESISSPPRIVVVGGGAAGLELSLALHARTRSTLPSAQVTSVTGHRTFGALFGMKADSAVRAELERVGVEQIVGRHVVRLDNGKAILDDSTNVPFDAAVIATGAAPSPLLTKTGLSLDPDGWISVRPTLQSAEYDNVFAVGDCAALESYTNSKFPPKAGVFAVRQGPVLSHNLHAYLKGRRALKKYVAQSSFLSLISTGDGAAVGSKYGIVFRGTWVFRLKMNIDEAWQKRFRVDKDMKENPTGQTDREKPVFDGPVPYAAAILMAADDIVNADTFDAQMSILRRMDEDTEFRNAIVNHVSGEE